MLAAHVFADQVSVFHGGVGGLARPVQFATGRGPLSVTTGDLDGDGRLDVVVGNGSDDVVTVLLAVEGASRPGDGFKQPANPVVADLDGEPGRGWWCGRTRGARLVRRAR